MTERLAVPFDLGEPPLIRALLARYDDHCLLGIAVDHIVFDGASIAVLLDDLEVVCGQLAAGRPGADLESGQSNFDDFAAAEQDWLQSPRAAAALDYWLPRWRAVGPSPALPLPVRAQATEGDGHGGRADYLLPMDECVDRHNSRTGGGLTPFVVISAALFTVLHEKSGNTDLGLMFPVSRRSRPDSRRGIGYYNNQLLLHVRLESGSRFPQVCSAVQEAVFGALRHAMMPVSVLKQRIAAEQSSPAQPTPYLYLNMLPQQRAPRLLGHRTEFTLLHQDNAYLGIPRLNVICQESEGRSMLLTSGHDGSRFEWSDVAAFLGRAVDLING